MCCLPASEEALDHFDLFVFAEGGVGVGAILCLLFPGRFSLQRYTPGMFRYANDRDRV